MAAEQDIERDRVLEELGAHIYRTLEEVDPGPNEIVWHELEEWERGMYRTCAEQLFRRKELLKRGLEVVYGHSPTTT